MATLTLVYEDEQETELRLSGVSLGTYLEIVRAWNALQGVAEIDDVEKFARKFADALLVSWTYPEPADADNFIAARDLAYMKAVVRDWIGAMAEVAAPLPVRSSASDPSPERLTEKPANRSGRRSSSRSRS